MTYQIKLTSSGDLDLSETGHPVFIDGQDAILQHIISRLSFAVGNFSIYLEAGTPFFPYVLGSKNKDLAAAVIKQRILETDGVKDLSNFTYEFDSSTRTMSISFTLNTIYGSARISNLNLGI